MGISANAKLLLDRLLGAAAPDPVTGHQVTLVGEFNFYDLATGAPGVAYFAWHHPGAPRLDVAAPPRLELPSFELTFVLDSAPVAGDEDIGGTPTLSSPSRESATIAVRNGDAAFDSLTNRKTYGGRKFILRIGPISGTLGDYETLFSWTFRSEPTFDTGSGSIVWDLSPTSLFDPSQALHKFADSYFKGTGGLEGGPAVKGREKPLVWGEVYGHQPAPLDAIGKDWLVHGNPAFSIEAVTAVYEGGIPLATPANYTVSLASGGVISLTSQPQNEITCDVKGVKFDAGAYSDSAAKIFRDLLVRHAGVASGSIDLGTYEADFPQVAGVAFGWGEAVSVEDALAEALRPRGAWYEDAGAGKVKIISLGTTHDKTISRAYGEGEIAAIAQAPSRRPLAQVRVRYRRRKRPVTDFALAVDPGRRVEQSSEWREEVWPPTPLASPHLNAAVAVVETPWVAKADALAEAKFQLDRWRDPKRLLDVTLDRRGLHSDPGDYVSVIAREPQAGPVRYQTDPGGTILIETGDRLLLETGDALLLEGGGATAIQVFGVGADFEAMTFKLSGVT